MDPSVEALLREMYIDTDWFRGVVLEALNSSGLCNVDSLVKKDCRQSVDFFQIFESHMYYAEVKPNSKADDATRDKRIITASLKSFYAGICSITQEKISGKKISEFNNQEFDQFLRYRVNHSTVSSIIEKECPQISKQEKELVEFLLMANTALKSKNSFDKCFEPANTDRIFSVYFDAGVTYAIAKSVV